MSQTGDNPFLGSIFICYRRQDSADTVDRIYEKLTPVFTESAIYRDLDTIPLGTDFATHITEALARCNVILVIIGPAWLDIRDELGRRRIDNPKDQVRVEIEIALNAPDAVVVPVLVREARMPCLEELPLSLQGLTRRNGAMVRPNPHFRSDVDRLVTALGDALEKASAAREERVRQAQQTAVALAAQTSEVRLAALTEEDWGQLLEALQAGQLVPVLGPAMGTVEIEGRRDALPRHLAAAVATRLELGWIPDNSRQPLQSVALRFAERGGSALRFVTALQLTLRDMALAPTEAVKELTLVEPLRLFVTTHLDHTLESALRAARGVEPISIYFAPNRPNDLPNEDFGKHPIVFHVTGIQEFNAAVTEADWLEFSAALVSQDRRPRRLFEALGGCRLLFLGGGHPTGFVRTLIHLASVSGDRGQKGQAWIGASAIDSDSALPDLLRARGSRDRLFDDGGGLAFVLELRRRWETWQRVAPPVKEEVHEQKSHLSPWIGLRAFSQIERSLFYGREREIDELLRLVRNQRLTILFGRSGLGKTSLINAGLIPKLHVAGFIPVPLRINWSSHALAFREQVFLALSDALAVLGIDGPRPNSSLCLWSYFHLRSTNFITTDGTELRPVLIFDQFEEVLTLRRDITSIDALAELGDLVEGRPPPELIMGLEEGRIAADEYELSRLGPGVLLSIREDWLVELDSLTSLMPSIRNHRFRLLPLSGRQALAAITLPDPTAIETDAAEQIVRFFATADDSGSKSEAIDNIEVIPSMLAVILNALNEWRIAHGWTKINSTLLAQLDPKSVLGSFYVKCFQGLPVAVREFVEDWLVTPDGMRDSIALSRFTQRLTQLGVGEDALEQLVHKSRLLAIVERWGDRRIQIAHDIFLPVVRTSREHRIAHL